MSFLEGLFSTSRVGPDVHPSSPFSGIFSVGGDTWAGPEVTEETALSATAVLCGVRLLSEVPSTLPLNLHQRRRGETSIDSDHPVHFLLHDEPNPEQASNVFRAQAMARMLLWGNAYAEIERNDFGEPVGLWPIHPTRVTLEEGDKRVRRYLVENRGKAPTPLRQQDMLHFQNFTLDGLFGIGLAALGREAIALAIAAEENSARLFGNFAVPLGFLRYKGSFKDVESVTRKIQKQFKKLVGGDSRHSLMVLEEDMAWEQVGLSSAELQDLATRKFQVTEVARVIGLPPHLLMDLERATFTNIEEQGRELLRFRVNPILVRYEQEFTRKLFPERRQRRRWFVKHNVDALQRGNLLDQTRALVLQVQNGLLTVDEARDINDRNPFGGESAKPLRPANIAPGDNPTESTAVATLGKGEALAMEWVSLFKSLAERFLRREVRAVQIATTRELAAGVDGFRQWVGTFYDRHSSHVAEQLRSPLEALGSTLEAEELAWRWCGVSKVDVLGCLEEEEPAAAIAALETTWNRRPLSLAEAIVEESRR